MVSPTGYQLLVAAGASLTGIAIFAADTEPSDGDITDFLIANHGVLERGRHALQQKCAVPLEYDAGFSQKQGDNFAPLRNLARSFAVEMQAAERLGDFSRAVNIGLNIFDLANATRRGGLVVDSLFAVALEGIVIERTRCIRHRLKPDDATRLANELLRIDASRESFDDVVARDRKWEEAVNYPHEEVDFINSEWPEAEKNGMDKEAEQALRQMLQSLADLPDDELRRIEKQLDDRNLALIRLLALESALICFHARHGIYPPDLCSLTPDYIAAIPDDPFTGAGFQYKRTPSGFLIYSPGPTGQDSGGTFGSWFGVLSGEADLGVDMYDHG